MCVGRPSHWLAAGKLPGLWVVALCGGLGALVKAGQSTSFPVDWGCRGPLGSLWRRLLLGEGDLNEWWEGVLAHVARPPLREVVPLAARLPGSPQVDGFPVIPEGDLRSAYWS